LLDIILNVNSLQEIGVKELKLKNNSYSIWSHCLRHRSDD
jgi:hypothetical protein